MKRILTTLCALALVMAGSATALAAEAASDSSYYPISVEEYTYGDFDELRINKTYQLSLGDDPSLIPTEDFTRNGRRYYLLDMTRKDEVGVDVQTYTETVTQASDTNNLETILQRLDAEMEVTTEDGYVGILRLDHTSVQVTTDGYATKTNTLSASRSYPNLSEADASLIPKSIEDKGKTLTLGDVKWSESMDVDGEGNPVTRYTATASYTGSTTSRYATGYTVSANYTGEVSKANCAVVTYTAIFGSEKAQEESKAPGTDEKHDADNDGVQDSQNPVSAVNTTKELADAVGIGQQTMSRVIQIDEHAPAAVKEALDSGDLSINQGYNITRQVQELPEEQRDEAAAMAVELEKAKKEIRQIDAEADRRGKISGTFCKAFERALALTPTEENVRIWVECTRMRPDEIEYSAQEAQELAEVFSTIAGILKTLVPGGDAGAG